MKKSVLLFLIVIISGLFFLSGCDVFKDDDPGTPQQKAGDTLWIHTVPKGAQNVWIHEIPLAIGQDGSVYYSASGGMANWEPSRIYAVNKNDGTIKWVSEPLENWTVNSNIVIGDDGTVYVLCYTKLYSIDPGTGSFNWIWEVPQTLPHDGNDVFTYGEVSSLALSDNGDLIFKTSGSGVYWRALYCVGTDGNMKWHRFIRAASNPITIGYNGIIYDYAAGDGNEHFIFATDPSSGAILWQTKAYTSYGVTNLTVADNGDLIAFVANDSLARIDPADGTIIWKSKVTEYSTHKILIDNNGVINLYANYNWGVYRYKSEDGTQTGQVLKNGLFCFDGTGKMYDAGVNGVKVYQYDGTEAWIFNTPASGNTLTISSDNVVYVATTDKVYAIQGDGSMAMGGWPAYAHDKRNTFNANKH